MQIIVLAAGQGKRMQSEVPKVLVAVKGKPMIEYLVEAIIRSGVCARPIIVVSPDNNCIIQQALKKYNCQYVIQKKQLGTGHALASAKKLVDKKEGHVISFYGDHPFVSTETIKKIAHSQNGTISIATVKLKDFKGWRKNFYHWGRIIRDKNRVKEIIEFKDANEKTRKIREVNPGFYCFANKWLWQNIKKLRKNNAQAEYYITDLIRLACEQNLAINSFAIDPQEAIGINNKEELAIAESLVAKINKKFK